MATHILYIYGQYYNKVATKRSSVRKTITLQPKGRGFEYHGGKTSATIDGRFSYALKLVISR